MDAADPQLSPQPAWFPMAGLPGRSGFSLVEVVLSLGIMSFVLVAILGLVPLGLATLRESMDATARLHITQTLLNEGYSGDPGAMAANTRYFDEYGMALASQTDEWRYKVKMRLDGLTVSHGGTGSGMSGGQTLVVAIESRNNPATDANWSMAVPVSDLPPQVRVYSAVLLK
ncbi:hypothetical protein DB346_16315 [Verrucomicrobia bacterium LW23]|nr:hypothetical protein DB346_16315 [Verrucomicrobia bacterium LW23]